MHAAHKARFYSKMPSRPPSLRPSTWSVPWVLLHLLHSVSLWMHAAAPELQHWFPVGGQVGETLTVTSVGKNNDWPPQIWTSNPEVRFTAEETPNTWSVEIGKNIPPGPVLIRLFNEEGASQARWFLVNETQSFRETEANHTMANANPVPIHRMIHGRLSERQDVDTYQVALKEGTTLIARMDAYVLGSTVDPLMRLLDADGRVLAINHDHYHLDPFITFDVSRSDHYYVQVMGFPYPANASQRFGNGDGYIYQLLLTDRPYMKASETLKEEGSVRLNLDGWNLHDVHFPPVRDGILPRYSDRATEEQRRLIHMENLSPEKEPNDRLETATGISQAARGRLDHPEDVDWYRWSPEAHTWYQLEVQSGRLGYEGDCLLKLYSEDGKEMASNDDAAGMRDPRIEWQSKDPQTCYLRVSSLLKSSQPPTRYRVIARPMGPSCHLTLESDRLNIQSGDSQELKLSIQRTFGHSKPILIKALHLPPGVSMPLVTAEANQKEILLVFHAAHSSRSYQGPIRIMGVDLDNRWNQYVAGKETVTTSVNNGVPNGYLDQVFTKVLDPWLTLTSASGGMDNEEP